MSLPEHPFQYALLRVVPHIARGERVNAGVVLFCRARRFLAARVALDEELVARLAPSLDLASVRAHLDALARVAVGDPGAGPVARLEPSERFHWLVAPSSTVIQASRVHTGFSADPAKDLERLTAALVARPDGTGQPDPALGSDPGGVIVAHVPRPPLSLVEFPADDPERARRFWSELLGAPLEERRDGEGEGWQTHSGAPAVGVHARGRGPGDSFSLPYFEVGDVAEALERVTALGGSVVHPGEAWAICRDSEGSPFALARKPG